MKSIDRDSCSSLLASKMKYNKTGTSITSRKKTIYDIITENLPDSVAYFIRCSTSVPSDLKKRMRDYKFSIKVIPGDTSIRSAERGSIIDELKLKGLVKQNGSIYLYDYLFFEHFLREIPDKCLE